MTLLSAVDMSHVLGMLSLLVPNTCRRQVHLILYASPNTELANSPRPWGQERAERVLGLELACCHHSQENTTQMCVQNPRMAGTSHGTNLGREDGELVTDSTSEDIDTEPSSSCLDILARRNQTENKSKCILVQHTTQGRSQLHSDTKNQCLGSCEYRSSCVFKVSLSSAAGPPTPKPHRRNDRTSRCLVSQPLCWPGWRDSCRAWCHASFPDGDVQVISYFNVPRELLSKGFLGKPWLDRFFQSYFWSAQHN